MDKHTLSALLREAVSSSNTDVVKQLLAEASAAGMLEQLFTAQDGLPGSTVLQVAAEKGCADIVRLLLSAGARIDAVDQLCRSALHYAARRGHADVVQLLLSAGADFELRSDYGCTALAEAAEHTQVDVLQALLQAGAAAHTVAYGGKTALILVAEDFGRIQNDGAACRCAELLVAAGAAVNTQDDNGLSALHWAANKASPSRVSMVQMLLAAGADIEAASCTGETPLYSAAGGLWPAAVTMLLTAGAAADAAEREGGTPLSVAAYAASGPSVRPATYWNPALQARAVETFSCFMAHNSTQPLAPAALVAAAAAAADRGLSTALAASEDHSRQRAVIRQLLSAAVQQDIAATRTALLSAVHEPRHYDPMEGVAVMTGVLLDMWLSAAAEQAELEAWLPTMQQVVVRVAAEQAEQTVRMYE